jgi:hypothetical protein
MTDKLVGLLPVKLQPYAKAVYPFVANIVYALVTLLATGSYDSENLKVNIVGLVGVLLTFLVPNKPKA